MRRTVLLLTVVAVLPLTACKKPAAKEDHPVPLGASGACPKEPDHRWAQRYALGTVPDYRVSGMGEAAKCHATFTPGPVFATRNGADGKPETYLANEGRFTGGCPDTDPHYDFESVKVAKVEVRDNRELSLAKPDDILFLTATPQDRCGFLLSPGTGNGWNARWSKGPGCDTVVAFARISGDDGPDGFDRPADTIGLKPVAAGSCTFGIDYLGVKGEVTVTVK